MAKLYSSALLPIAFVILAGCALAQAPAEPAERQTDRVTATELLPRAAAGEEAAVEALLNIAVKGATPTDGRLAVAFRGTDATRVALAEALARRLQAEKKPMARCKLCWLLGQNGSPAAQAELRAIIAKETDGDVVANAAAALTPYLDIPENLAAMKSLAADPRPFKIMIGFYERGQGDDRVGRPTEPGQEAAPVRRPMGECISGWLAARDAAAVAAVPGEIVIEPPTLICLGFEWHITGDANLNSSVVVQYRPKGEEAWKQGMPFLRCRPGPNPFYKTDPGNLLAGSLFDLTPDTEYEVKLTLSDPDGGAAEKIVTARTRAEPPVYAGERVLHVIPGTEGGAGTKEDPFRGLAEAAKIAQPGDVFLLAEGAYAGEAAFKKSGAPGKPIVLRGVNRDKVVLRTEGKTALNISNQKWIHIENMTVSGGHATLSAYHTEEIVIRRCLFLDANEIAISGQGSEGGNSRNWYVADNVIIGNGKQHKGRKRSSYGIGLNGAGHVICHNRIENSWDAISLQTKVGSTPPTMSVDVYNNDIVLCSDDGIESDYIHHNVRVFRNRIRDTLCALSFQPAFGGPNYLLRNDVVNFNLKAFKFHVDPTGMIIAHNTCVGAPAALGGGNWDNGIFRNNLFLGASYPGGAENRYSLSTTGSRADFDYNGYNRLGPGWMVKLNSLRYPSLADFAAGAGQETHGVEVDWDVFAEIKSVPVPARGGEPLAVNLALNPAGKAVDAGVTLPNLNDGFTGKAPDLGCYEVGQPMPHYGPREPK